MQAKHAMRPDLNFAPKWEVVVDKQTTGSKTKSGLDDSDTDLDTGPWGDAPDELMVLIDDRTEWRAEVI